jgi:hypothetical protein
MSFRRMRLWVRQLFSRVNGETLSDFTLSRTFISIPHLLARHSFRPINPS